MLFPLIALALALPAPPFASACRHAAPAAPARQEPELVLELSRGRLAGAGFVDAAALRDTLRASGVDRVRFALGTGEVLRASLGNAARPQAGAMAPRAWFVVLGEELGAAGIQTEAWIAPDAGAEDPSLQAAARGVLGALFAGDVLHERPDGVVFGLGEADARALFGVWQSRAGEAFRVAATIDEGTGALSPAARAALRGLTLRIEATYGVDVLAAAFADGSALLAQDSAPAARALVDQDPSTAWSVGAAAQGAVPAFTFTPPLAFDRVRVRAGRDGAREADAELTSSAESTSSAEFTSNEGPTFRLWAAAPAGADGSPALELVASGPLEDLRPSVPCTRHVVASALRLEVDAAGGAARIAALELFESPPVVRIEPAGELSLSPIPVALATRPGAHIRYTLDGSAPGASSPRYTQPLRLLRSATLRARAFDGRGAAPDEARASFVVVTEDDWRPGVEFVKPPAQGLRVEIFETSIDSLVQLERQAPIARRDVAGLDALADASRAQRVALRYRGFVRVPEDGLYTFELRSDDGSRLFVHGELVVENDGHHGMRSARGRVPLRAGFHPLRVEWFNGVGPGGLEVSWSGPGVGRGVPLPTSALYR